MRILSNEHDPSKLRWAEEDEQEINELAKHREWLKERLEVHAHNTRTREILAGHLKDVRFLIKQKIEDYKVNYGKAH